MTDSNERFNLGSGNPPPKTGWSPIIYGPAGSPCYVQTGTFTYPGTTTKLPLYTWVGLDPGTCDFDAVDDSLIFVNEIDQPPVTAPLLDVVVDEMIVALDQRQDRTCSTGRLSPNEFAQAEIQDAYVVDETGDQVIDEGGDELVDHSFFSEGAVNWSNMGGAKQLDLNYATHRPVNTGKMTTAICATDFKANIPLGSTIVGIKAYVTRSIVGGAIQEEQAGLKWCTPTTGSAEGVYVHSHEVPDLVTANASSYERPRISGDGQYMGIWFFGFGGQPDPNPKSFETFKRNGNDWTPYTKIFYDLTSGSNPVRAATFSNDGKYLCLSDLVTGLQVWFDNGTAFIQQFATAAPVSLGGYLQMSGDGATFVYGTPTQAFFYRRTGAAWSLRHTLTYASISAVYHEGFGLSSDGSTLLVTDASQASNNSKDVTVVVETATDVWTEAAVISADADITIDERLVMSGDGQYMVKHNTDPNANNTEAYYWQRSGNTFVKVGGPIVGLEDGTKASLTGISDDGQSLLIDWFKASEFPNSDPPVRSFDIYKFDLDTYKYHQTIDPIPNNNEGEGRYSFDRPRVAFAKTSKDIIVEGRTNVIDARDPSITNSSAARVSYFDDTTGLSSTGKICQIYWRPENAVTDYSVSDKVSVFGGDTDTWNGVLTAEDINRADFGVVFRVNPSEAPTLIRSDLIQIEIIYECFQTLDPVDTLPPGLTDGLVTTFNGLMIAVGSQGRIFTSDDSGATWTPRISGVFSDLQSVIWEGDEYIAVGTLGSITTSPDGITWTPQSRVTNEVLFDIIEDEGAILLVGSNQSGFWGTDINNISPVAPDAFI